ncbi:uncharacterized protein LOC144114150 [Amblyomma americanum]
MASVFPNQSERQPEHGDHDRRCGVCDKVFTQRKNMLQHMRMVHKLETKGAFLHCDQCSSLLSTLENLVHHYNVAHKFPAENLQLSFGNDKEFHDWKGQEEASQVCKFVISTGEKRLTNGCTRTYYACNRSGVARPGRGNKTRAMKSQGSCRSGRTCLSFLIVTRDEGTVKVSYQRTHYGHDADVEHLSMTDQERASIADDLSKGVPMRTILKKIRESVTSKLTPLHLTNRMDLHNIKRQYNLTVPERCHDNDAVSVSIWVQSMRNKGQPVVRLYKEQEVVDPTNTFSTKDFALALMTEPQEELLKVLGTGTVCVDSTHGTTGYQFELVTVLVLDEYGAGLPMAYFICSTINEKTLSAFFESLKSSTGALSARTFMTDDASEYFKAWSTVMGPPQHRLLCTWHVDKNWKRRISEKIKGKELAVDVYHAVRTLLECPKKDEVAELLESFLANKDPRLQEFIQYFRGNYAHRLEMWAYSFRTGLGINTNMYLERMHRTLKHSFLEGKKNHRVDRLITALMDMTYESLMKRVQHIVKAKRTSKMSRIEKNHRSAVAITTPAKRNEDGTWTVQSQSTRGLTYRISKEKGSACCPLKCSECMVCVHSYSCDCEEHRMSLTICKHIHCVVIAGAPEGRDQKILKATEAVSSNSKASEAFHILESVQTAEASTSMTKSDLVLAKMELLKEYVAEQEIPQEVHNKASKLLDPVLKIYEGTKKQEMPHTSREPANKKIEHQVRFHSTKKQRLSSSGTSFSKPTELQKENIKKQILNSNAEATVIITSPGHNYI